MKLCDRCPDAAACLLDCLGKACRDSRKKNRPDLKPTTAELLCAEDLHGMADMIAAYAEECGAGALMGLSHSGVLRWLEQEHDG